MRETAILRHRRRFHHNEGGTRRRGRFPALQLLQQQQRKPAGDRDLVHEGDQVTCFRTARRSPTPAPPATARRCLKAALMLDEGEVETISHYYAAAFFDPDVDCILDIGGQDMKCIQHQGRHRGQCPAQRGMFLRLRFLYRDLRKILKL